MMWLPTNGTMHQDPDQPVDHGRHRGQQPHDRLQNPPEWSGANSTMNIAESSAKTDADQTAQIVIRAVA